MKKEMTENKISFTLHKFDKALLFQINDQYLSEKYNGAIDIFNFKKGRYLIKIRKDCLPDIKLYGITPHLGDLWISKEIEIWLRGSDASCDNKICKLDLKSNEERDEIYNTIIETFKKLQYDS